MRKILRVDNIIRKMIQVEVALAKGLEEAGIAPRGLAKELEKALDSISSREVYEYEKKLGHEIGALVWLLSKMSGRYGGFVHYGATSNDIIDTAWALILREALGVVEEKLKKLVSILIDRIRREGGQVLIGRTHGQHALPVTWGFKLANYVYELARSYERLVNARKRVIKIRLKS